MKVEHSIKHVNSDERSEEMVGLRSNCNLSADSRAVRVRKSAFTSGRLTTCRSSNTTSAVSRTCRM